MKKYLFIILSLVITFNLAAQDTLKFKRQYYLKKSAYEAMPNDEGEIIFLGNSITAGCPWGELFNNSKIKNRGISGDVTEGILFRLDEITESRPAKIFMMIGVNDLSFGKSKKYILKNYKEIIDRILSESPDTKIYVQSILPVNSDFDYFENHTNKIDSILCLNKSLMELAEEKELTYIDLFTSFADENLKLKSEYTLDGLHLTGKGYLQWKELIEKYVYE